MGRDYRLSNAGRMISYAFFKRDEAWKRREDFAEQMLAYILQVQGSGDALLRVAGVKEGSFQYFEQQAVRGPGRPDFVLHHKGDGDNRSVVLEIKVGAGLTNLQTQDDYWGSNGLLVCRTDDYRTTCDAVSTMTTGPTVITWNQLKAQILPLYSCSIAESEDLVELWTVLVDYAETALLETAPVTGKASPLTSQQWRDQLWAALQRIVGKDWKFESTKDTARPLLLSPRLGSGWFLEFDPTTGNSHLPEPNGHVWPFYWARWSRSGESAAISYLYFPLMRDTKNNAQFALPDASTVRDLHELAVKLHKIPTRTYEPPDSPEEKLKKALCNRQQALARLDGTRSSVLTGEAISTLAGAETAEPIAVVQYNQTRLEYLHELFLRVRDLAEQHSIARLRQWCGDGLEACREIDTTGSDSALAKVVTALVWLEELVSGSQSPASKAPERLGASASSRFSDDGQAGALLWHCLWSARRTRGRAVSWSAPVALPTHNNNESFSLAVWDDEANNDQLSLHVPISAEDALKLEYKQQSIELRRVEPGEKDRQAHDSADLLSREVSAWMRTLSGQDEAEPSSDSRGA